ncbi:Crp/Fnr family transcriptional regulator [Acinetobacter larvae]|uniref:Cyclic nucleotide-binding domain-containing protein n=1 Tax=Acinetobacter larvae TaxID=1789224 RepID=A0A1B2LVS3_9GAMM|nr:Crp/Fnr family transcriptional regulator [Acinetobacter larvae]AOA57038.1 hypothetical protein BFG52_00810 [Acinetobacter larvae]
MLNSANPISLYQAEILRLPKNNCSTADYIQRALKILQNYNFLQHLSASEHALLLNHLKIKRYVHHQVIYHQNQPSNEVMIIIDGTLKLGWHVPNAQYHTDSFIPSGTMINIVPVITQQPLMHEYIAQGSTIVANLAGDMMREILQHNARAQYALFNIICVRTQLQRANAVFASTLSLRTRLVKEILFLIHYHFYRDDIKLNQANFAELLQSTRQKINKEFAYLVQQGLVEVKYNRIRILDYAGLKQLSEHANPVATTEFI